MVFGILFFVIIMIVLFKLEREMTQKKHYMEQLNQYEQYNYVYKDLIKEIRHRQHDFNNHLQAIYSLSMSCDDIERLRKEQSIYFEKICDENRLNSLIRESNSSVLVAFIAIKIKEVERKGVSITYKINIEQIEKKILFPDIVEMFGNLLDNAVEATLKNKIKKIWFDIEEIKAGLHLNIANTYEWKEDEQTDCFLQDGFSTKRQGSGYGLTNVNRIIEKYKGILQIKFDYICEYKIVKFDVFLPFIEEVSKF